MFSDADGSFLLHGAVSRGAARHLASLQSVLGDELGRLYLQCAYRRLLLEHGVAASQISKNYTIKGREIDGFLPLFEYYK